MSLEESCLQKEPFGDMTGGREEKGDGIAIAHVCVCFISGMTPSYVRLDLIHACDMAREEKRGGTHMNESCHTYE